MSPLLVISQDRRYAQAVPPGAAAEAAAVQAVRPATQDLYRRADSFRQRAADGEAAADAAGAAAAGQAPVSGLEAMYGAQPTAQQQQAQQQAAGAAGGGAASGGQQQWAGLFDAPSHVLPPLSTLCPAFLELVVGREDGSTAGEEQQQ